jgi:hypothetical protein
MRILKKLLWLAPMIVSATAAQFYYGLTGWEPFALWLAVLMAYLTGLADGIAWRRS